jgi:hypothetical protein
MVTLLVFFDAANMLNELGDQIGELTLAALRQLLPDGYRSWWNMGLLAFRFRLVMRHSFPPVTA